MAIANTQQTLLQLKCMQDNEAAHEMLAKNIDVNSSHLKDIEKKIPQLEGELNDTIIKLNCNYNDFTTNVNDAVTKISHKFDIVNDNLNDNIHCLQNNISIFSKDLTSLDEKFNEWSKNINQDSFNIILNGIEKIKSDNDNNFNAIRNELYNLNNQFIQENSTQLSTFMSMITTNQKDILSLKETLSTFPNKISENYITIQKEFAQFQEAIGVQYNAFTNEIYRVTGNLSLEIQKLRTDFCTDFKKLDENLNEYKCKQDTINNEIHLRIDEIDNKIEETKKELSERIDKEVTEINNHFNKLDNDIDKVHKEYDEIKSQNTQIISQHDDMIRRITNNENNVSALNTDMIFVKKEIEALRKLIDKQTGVKDLDEIKKDIEKLKNETLNNLDYKQNVTFISNKPLEIDIDKYRIIFNHISLKGIYDLSILNIKNEKRESEPSPFNCLTNYYYHDNNNNFQTICNLNKGTLNNILKIGDFTEGNVKNVYSYFSILIQKEYLNQRILITLIVNRVNKNITVTSKNV